MTHENRSRIKVDANGDWKAYIGDTLRARFEPIGTITRAGKTGALLRVKTTGLYVMMADGAISSLPQQKIESALRGPGRPKTIGTRPVTLSLDDSTIQKAQSIGGGNISAGIRIAVEKYKLY